jgi:hypothetical protein
MSYTTQTIDGWAKINFSRECETYKTLEFLDKDKKNRDVPATARQTMEKWPGIPGSRFGTSKLKCDSLGEIPYTVTCSGTGFQNKTIFVSKQVKENKCTLLLGNIQNSVDDVKL